jgi:hypothetical protein
MGKPGRYEAQAIEPMILTIRGQKVILDTGLPRIYGVPTKRLNEQVRRNADRFPPDFAFVLTDQKFTSLNPSLPPSLYLSPPKTPHFQKIQKRCILQTVRI